MMLMNYINSYFNTANDMPRKFIIDFPSIN